MQSQGAREAQEDYLRFALDADGAFAIVCDGMGGHTSGDRAARAAGDAAFDRLRQDRLVSNEVVAEATSAVAEESRRNGAAETIGATLLAVRIDDLGLSWVSVGDSVLYLLRGAKLQRLNADHSLTPQLQRLAQSKRALVERSSVLRSAINGQMPDLVDLRAAPLKLFRGDCVLVASDGVFTLSDSEIANLLDRMSPSESTSAILAAIEAKALDGQDNTSVIVVRVDDGPASFPSLFRILGGPKKN
jgi:serine/threonine protein phosphatase PrpC